MSEADQANARSWSKLLAARRVGRALSPQAREAAVERIFQKALESLWQANFHDSDEKKNAAQMLVSLLGAVAGYFDISQNAPLCDKARVLKCRLETLPVPQPDLHSAFECMCAQAKERIFRVLDGTSAGMELKKAAGAVYEATRTDRALVQSLTDAMAVVEKLVGSADGLSVERMADVIGDIALHQPCVSQLLQVFAVLLTCRYMQASCPPATLRARHMPGLTSTRRQFGLSAATSCERARRWVALSARRGGASSTSTGSVSATTSGRCMSTCRNGFSPQRNNCSASLAPS